jgi:DNA-directed RNA polymerase subunit delta
MTNEGLSLVDVAEIILKEAKEPLNIYDIFDAVCTRKEINEDLKNDLVSQFYADITVSAKFVYVGENTWDLKENQKIELWEKDGSFYKEYTEVEIPEEYLEKPAKKAPKVVKAKPEPTPESVVEEVVVEAAPVVEEVPVVEEKVEPVVEEVASVTPDKEESTEEFEEELFDDFDEDKYNEYMDTYEDQYED